jgi:hypothetical protein
MELGFGRLELRLDDSEQWQQGSSVAVRNGDMKGDFTTGVEGFYSRGR